MLSDNYFYPIKLYVPTETLNKHIQDNWGISGSVKGRSFRIETVYISLIVVSFNTF